MAGSRLTVTNLRMFCIGIGLIVLVIYFILAKTRFYQPLVWSSPDQARWKPHKVLLFTYARSGSSFTGDVIYHSPDVYYVYEPLMRFAVKDGTKTNQMLQSLLSCQFSPPAIDKLYGVFLKRFQETQLLLNCKKYNRGTVALRRCETIAESVCRSFSVTMVKVIRYNMAHAESFLSDNPDLAEIFLVRDPRASIWSRINVFHFPNKTSLPDFAKNLCQKMEADFLKAHELVKTFPQRIRFLRYEDLADNPVAVARQIYNFLQLNWTDTIRQLVQNQTKSANNETRPPQKLLQQHFKHAYSLNRPDSALAASQWRLEMPLDMVQTVQNACADVMALLGYTPFTSTIQLRNLTLEASRTFDLRTDNLDLGKVEST